MGVIAKYKFNNTLEANLLPEFNSEFTSDLYTVTDEVNGDGSYTIRTIESDSLPTLMRFGRVYVVGETDTDNRTDSLLEVLDMNTSGLTSMYSMFRYCKNLTSIICEWNTSNVTSMNNMFNNCYNLTSLDVSNFNTSNVTTMYGMFFNCNNLISVDVSNFNTSNVTNMKYMFYNCNNLTILDVSNFNTSNVTDMNSMFGHCQSLTSLDVSKWDTSNVTGMSSMFHNCNNLTSLNVSNFNTSNVTTMNSMFYNCTNLTSLDVSNFDTSNVTTMHDMFSWCYNLTTLDLSNFNTSNVTDMTQMFYNCTKLTSLDVSNFDTSNVTNTTNMFNNTPLLADIGVLYMDKSSLQKLVNAMPTDSNKTLWYKDVDIDGITHGDNITLKKYIEENVEIVLNSPLLMGDTIEVVDGKLCHVSRHYLIKNLHELSITTHLGGVSPSNTMLFRLYLQRTNTLPTGVQFSVFSDKFKEISNIWNKDEEGVAFDDLNNQIIDFRIDKSKLSTQDISGFKQWLSENPTIVVYELAEPYYEDITPLQSSLTLRTFNECNIQIITTLPIKTKITYRTNITSAVVMEQELDTLDSGVNLSNLIEEEVDE